MKLDNRLVKMLRERVVRGRYVKDYVEDIENLTWVFLCKHCQEVKTISPRLQNDFTELVHPNLRSEFGGKLNEILVNVFNLQGDVVPRDYELPPMPTFEPVTFVYGGSKAAGLTNMPDSPRKTEGGILLPPPEGSVQ